MRIYLRELKANFKSLLIYTGVVAFFVVVGFQKFTAYAQNPEILDVLDSMPKAMLDTFYMNAFNLTTVEGFFGVMYAFVALILAIAAVMWGSEIISKEERDKTVEFALTLPVKRSTLITAKAAAALTNCILLALATWGLNAVSASGYDPGPEFYTFLFQGMAALVLLQVIFLSIGIFIGCAMKQHKRAGSVAISILLGTYFFSVIAGLRDEWDFLKYLSPFKYFDPVMILRESRIEPVYLWLSAGIIVACLSGAYLIYQRRDLYI
ncbi:MAG: ABC transporter permease subunit [Anaerolineales bacterium]